eukprot:UN02341
MWFYQKTEASKFSIFFHEIKLNILRGLDPVKKINYIDLGPNTVPEVEKLKAEFGFPGILDWKIQCKNYDGEFRDTVLLQQSDIDYSKSPKQQTKKGKKWIPKTTITKTEIHSQVLLEFYKDHENPEKLANTVDLNEVREENLKRKNILGKDTSQIPCKTFLCWLL